MGSHYSLILMEPIKEKHNPQMCNFSSVCVLSEDELYLSNFWDLFTVSTNLCIWILGIEKKKEKKKKNACSYETESMCNVGEIHIWVMLSWYLYMSIPIVFFPESWEHLWLSFTFSLHFPDISSDLFSLHPIPHPLPLLRMLRPSSLTPSCLDNHSLFLFNQFLLSLFQLICQNRLSFFSPFLSTGFPSPIWPRHCGMFLSLPLLLDNTISLTSHIALPAALVLQPQAALFASDGKNDLKRNCSKVEAGLFS